MAATAQIDVVKTLHEAETKSDRATASADVNTEYSEGGYAAQTSNGNLGTDNAGALDPNTIAGGDPYELYYAGKTDSNG